jgi:hypothetical protein
VPEFWFAPMIPETRAVDFLLACHVSHLIIGTGGVAALYFTLGVGFDVLAEHDGVCCPAGDGFCACDLTGIGGEVRLSHV